MCASSICEAGMSCRSGLSEVHLTILFSCSYCHWSTFRSWSHVLQVKDLITKLAKKGSTPSQIGVVLRDQHGVAQVKRMNNSQQ